MHGKIPAQELLGVPPGSFPGGPVVEVEEAENFLSLRLPNYSYQTDPSDL